MGHDFIRLNSANPPNSVKLDDSTKHIINHSIVFNFLLFSYKYKKLHVFRTNQPINLYLLRTLQLK